jgi:hypothetical protein
VRSIWIFKSKIEIGKTSKIVDFKVIIYFFNSGKERDRNLSIIIMINSAPFIFNYYQILLRAFCLNFACEAIGKIPIERELKWLGF